MSICTILPSKLQTVFQFRHIFFYASFLSLDPVPAHSVVCHLSLPQSWPLCILSLSLMTFTLGGILVTFSVKYLSIHVYLRLSCDYIEMVHFGQEYHRSDIVSSLVHHIRVFMIGNVLLTMISVSITRLKCLLGFFFFFGCNVTIFPYVINKYLFRGDTLWLCWYLVFPQTVQWLLHPLVHLFCNNYYCGSA